MLLRRITVFAVLLEAIAAIAVIGFVASVKAGRSGFPTPSTVGVREGSKLMRYSGRLTITRCGVHLDHVTVDGDLTIAAGNGAHAIYNDEAAAKAAACVTIANSRIMGIIDDKYTGRGFGPVFIADTEVAGNGQDVAAISDSNLHVWRTYVHGNRSGGQCDGYCEFHDSYLLADTEIGKAHMDAFISNGAYGAPILLDHSTFLCRPTGRIPKGAGCAADIGLFGDRAPITDVTVRDSLFKATPAAFYCLHSGWETHKLFPHGARITYIDNVFERGPSGACGAKGPVYEWSADAGTWCRNRWDDGTPNVLKRRDTCP